MKRATTSDCPRQTVRVEVSRESDSPQSRPASAEVLTLHRTKVATRLQWKPRNPTAAALPPQPPTIALLTNNKKNLSRSYGTVKPINKGSSSWEQRIPSPQLIQLQAHGLRLLANKPSEVCCALKVKFPGCNFLRSRIGGRGTMRFYRALEGPSPMSCR